ncbi:phosphatase PAP2 family protein [Streptomyces sp. H27-C3]|uniref:phosphatase PAP2 family protein n=1 Tax=Streptomyces sp. H27-C3 TaxID=3046305 RepID=UPI0024B94F1C|nr:phosphatase PAP2 family protein [Streptomyces sp. H27-C3]MDJ0463890.1 phosphatase PAP2 family protein [Streptomyces sp. H27-C3]
MPDTPAYAPDASTAPRPRPSSAAPPPVRATALGLVFVLTTVAVGSVVRTDPIRPPFQSLDDRWLAWMSGPRNGLYAAMADVLNLFGGPLGVVVPVALLTLLSIRRRWWSLLYLLTTHLVGNMLVVQFLKYWVDRPRPENPLVRVDHGSFPSGHVVGAALLVVIVGALFVRAASRRWWCLVGVLFTVAMMWSRTWLHAHWLTDTAVGAMAGAALLLWRAFAPLLAQEAGRLADEEPESQARESSSSRAWCLLRRTAGEREEPLRRRTRAPCHVRSARARYPR